MLTRHRMLLAVSVASMTLLSCGGTGGAPLTNNDKVICNDAAGGHDSSIAYPPHPADNTDIRNQAKHITFVGPQNPDVMAQIVKICQAHGYHPSPSP